ncbi:Riboflavin synthase [Methylacidimicrobium sp. AP8]|uniref:riboflavin synthase n=1 Tax=Methylacidimicrobium sp. AP8 TaxID=2730359 RepID=UPI0018C00783|nr:riboflavin synthase [Methylacidimicrobium sp. AP8]CAB4244684.1 Riboflavin synthase [Methylacidimicrobium sp. AP8]
MFTGIVESVGRVEEPPTADHPALWIDAGALAEGLRPGDSVAVNGCCLTVTARQGGLLRFDTLEETRKRSNIGLLAKEDLVNLERPVAVGSRINGHFVTGHVDGLSRLLEIHDRGSEHELWLERPAPWEALIVPKGSVAVDGISLTVGSAREDRFSVWITPFTWQATNLRTKRPGDLLNIEVDILARYVAAQRGRPLSAGA